MVLFFSTSIVLEEKDEEERKNIPVNKYIFRLSHAYLDQQTITSNSTSFIFEM